MFFHVVMTTECNLQCRYCFEEAAKDFDPDFRGPVDNNLPEELDYATETLDEFCKKDPDCSIIFYGGEPLLCAEKIKEIMDRVNAKNFLIQTNGILLDRLEPEYLNRLHTIAVSIDGDRELTDFYRGSGTLQKIITNLKRARENGFSGELIARMTVMEQTDIHKQVRWLLENDEFSFSSVHWQLNAGFWNDFERRDFKRWVDGSYNPGVSRLVKFWVDTMEKNGQVLKLYPIIGVARPLLLEEKCLLPCGAGWVNYAIQTDGNIVPCPSMWGMKDFYLGHVSSSSPLDLRKVLVEGQCQRCDVFNVCGGRCLYSHVFKRWSDEAHGIVCGTVRHLVESVKKELPRVRSLLDDGRIGLEDLEFMRYNGCEIIP
jgi:putative peptide-modifying radical SAM enzyme